MDKEAALKEWLSWMAQPLSVILKEHKDFIYGPVNDLMDEVIRKLAPKIVESVGEREIDEDVEEFTDGAREGRFEALQGFFRDPERGQSDDYYAGYEWGFSAAHSWDGKELPSQVKRRVVKEQIQEFQSQVTEKVVSDLMKKAWSAVSPAHTLKVMVSAVKKHGWKIGLSFALFEIVEHTILPAVMIKLTGDPEWAVLGTLPIGEIIYALVLRAIGRADNKLDEITEDGHLDWYVEKYGPVRLAHSRGLNCGRVAHKWASQNV
jgi:hypothetical protein